MYFQKQGRRHFVCCNLCHDTLAHPLATANCHSLCLGTRVTSHATPKRVIAYQLLFKELNLVQNFASGLCIPEQVTPTTQYAVNFLIWAASDVELILPPAAAGLPAVPASSQALLLDTPALPYILQYVCNQQEQGSHALQCSSPVLGDVALLQGSSPVLRDVALLQGSSPALRDVALLLCTRKALRAAIAQHCSGLLCHTISSTSIEEALEQVELWLPRHGQLLRELQLDLYDDIEESEVAVALTQAAAGTSGLQLQRLVHLGAGSAAQNVLSVLSTKTLTSLTIHTAAGQVVSVRQLLGAVTAFTSLQSLSWLQVSGEVDEAFLQALAGLHQLTSLTISPLTSAAELRHLPAQVAELTVQLQQREAGAMQLGHLTGLTYLLAAGTLPYTMAKCGGVLPPTLRWLHVGDCQHATDLLPLTQLQHLVLQQSSMPAEELQLLSGLGGLTQLGLGYDSAAAAAAAAAAWPSLPLVTLKVCMDQQAQEQEAEAITRGLAQLTRLTALQLLTDEKPYAVTPQQLAATMSQLTGLRQLRLFIGSHQHVLDVSVQQHPEQQQVEGLLSYAPLMAAFGGLPALRAFEFRSEVDWLAVQRLAAAGSHLTSLALFCPNTDDYAVCLLASSLTGLRQLCVYEQASDGEVGDASLVVISRSLLQLTRLDMMYTGITERGVQHLSNLPKLCQLDVRELQ